jgi:hypothetical protein
VFALVKSYFLSLCPILLWHKICAEPALKRSSYENDFFLTNKKTDWGSEFTMHLDLMHWG